MMHKRLRSIVVLLLVLNMQLVGTAADWHVRIDGVYGQSIDFGTGDDSGASMKVELYDACRVDSAYRNELGELYPGNSVQGFEADHNGIVNDPGCCNKISFSFTEAINQTSIYADQGNNQGKIQFCAQVALYDGSTLVNLAEVRVEYSIDYNHGGVHGGVQVQTYTITDAAGYVDAEDASLRFDGSLEAVFCDPNTFEELHNDGHVTEQGSTLSVCFRVTDGQFEISDVMYLTVKNAAESEPSQDFIVGSHIVEDSIALKSCSDHGHHDTNVCVVQFILKADFYDYHRLTLTGFGMVILELGDAPDDRRQLVSVAPNEVSDGRSLVQTGDDGGQGKEGVLSGHYVTKPFAVRPLKLSIYEDPDRLFRTSRRSGESTTKIFGINLLGIIFAVAGFAGVVIMCVYYNKGDNEATEKRDVLSALGSPKKSKDVHQSQPLSLTEFMDDSSCLTGRRPFELDQLESLPKGGGMEEQQGRERDHREFREIKRLVNV